MADSNNDKSYGFGVQTIKGNAAYDADYPRNRDKKIVNENMAVIGLMVNSSTKGEEHSVRVQVLVFGERMIESVINTVKKGTPLIVTGRVSTRGFDRTLEIPESDLLEDGDEESVYEISYPSYEITVVADEIGVNLRFGGVTYEKQSNSGGGSSRGGAVRKRGPAKSSSNSNDSDGDDESNEYGGDEARTSTGGKKRRRSPRAK